MTNTLIEEVMDSIESPFLKEFNKHTEFEYNCILNGKSRTWDIRLQFGDDFPYKLPRVELLTENDIGVIPHVSVNGIICVEENDSIIINYHKPVDVVTVLLQQVTRLLERSRLKICQHELSDEYEGYFQFSNHISATVHSFYHAKDRTEYIYIYSFSPDNPKRATSKPVLMKGVNIPLPDGYSNLDQSDKHQREKGIHIALDRPVMPPAGGQSLSIDYILKIASFSSVKNKRRLNKILKKSKTRFYYYVLLSMPRITGERSQVLFKCSNSGLLPHPLIEQSDDWKVESYLLNRHNKEYLIERGGATLSLADKKVSIVGCGSVGGEIAVMIAKAGVGELILVDRDLFYPDNVYRHRLGGASLNFKPNPKSAIVQNKRKVSLLAAMLQAELPYVKVKIKDQYFQKLEQDTDILASDVVIVAVGSPTANFQINRSMKVMGIQRAIFCWNEAASLGGHSIAINFEHSCYECLFSDEIGFKNSNDLDLLQTGKTISKNLTGCAGVFTPFSYIDSSQTAALAAQQCVEVLLYDLHSQALTWKGENREHLEVTDRFNKIALKESTKVSRSNGCQVCNG